MKHAMTIGFILTLMLIVGCNKELKPPIGPTRVETVDFIKTEVEKRILPVDLWYFKSVMIDEKGRTLTFQWTPDHHDIVEYKIVLEGTTISMAERNDNWGKQQVIEFHTTINGNIKSDQIEEDGKVFFPKTQNSYEICLKDDPFNAKTLNALLHLQDLAKFESKDISSKF